MTDIGTFVGEKPLRQLDSFIVSAPKVSLAP